MKLYIKLSNSQLNKLKSGIKKLLTLNIFSNVVGDSIEENNFPHRLLLTNANIPRLCRAFPNGSSADIKLSTHIFPKLYFLERDEALLFCDFYCYHETYF